jgi:hypothetical protein
MRHGVLIAIVLGLSNLASAQSQPNAPKNHAEVDVTPIVALAGPLDTEVDVYFDAAMLKILSRRFAKDDPALSAFLQKLKLVNSIVVTFANAVPKKAIDDAIRKLEETLKPKGWRRLARISEPGLTVNTFIHMNADDIDGLLVISLNQNRLIFCNIVGQIDLAELGGLSGTIAIPGLKRLPTIGDPRPQDEGSTPKPTSQPSTSGGRP